MAGYSKTPLLKKLGIKAGDRLCFINPPQNYGATLGELPAGLTRVEEPVAPLNFIQLFTKQQVELEAQFPKLKQVLAFDGMLWVSWPKKAARVETDLDGNIVREIGLKNGLVDVKVCAVDETWSGLKFVYRKKERK